MRALHSLITATLLVAFAPGCAVLDALGGGGGDDDGISPTGDAGLPLDAPGFYRTVPANLNRDLDLLVLVDNSGSMIAEQQSLTANFPNFINVLNQVQGGLPNIHLGIISSNVGAAGAAAVPGCAAAGDDGNLLTGPPNNTCSTQFGLQGTYISDIAQPNGTRMRNYTGTLAQLFACMASLGNTGCGFEMHLESVYRALQPGKNPGFYRSDALLAVIIVADEDDCSTERGEMFGDPNAGISSQLGPRTSFRCHEFGVRCQNDATPRSLGAKSGCVPDANSTYMFEVQRYIDFMRNLKSDPSRIVVAGIVGTFDRVNRDVTVGPDRRTNDPNLPEVLRSCFARDPNDPDDGATPPVRTAAFIDALSEPQATQSLCASDLSAALIAIGKQIKVAIGDPCIDSALADDNPNMPGLQPACTVIQRFGDQSTPITQCTNAVQTGSTCDPGTAGTPCWCLHADPQTCPAPIPSNLALSINTGGATPPLGTKYLLYCRT